MLPALLENIPITLTTELSGALPWVLGPFLAFPSAPFMNLLEVAYTIVASAALYATKGRLITLLVSSNSTNSQGNCED